MSLLGEHKRNTASCFLNDIIESMSGADKGGLKRPKMEREMASNPYEKLL